MENMTRIGQLSLQMNIDLTTYTAACRNFDLAVVQGRKIDSDQIRQVIHVALDAMLDTHALMLMEIAKSAGDG